MSKAYANGVLSSFTLIPSENVSLNINKIKDLYGSIPDVSWNKSAQNRAEAARKIRHTVNKLVFFEKELRHNLDLKLDLCLVDRDDEATTHFVHSSPTSSQKSLLSNRRVEYILSPDGVSRVPVTSKFTVFSEGENEVEDSLSIRQDWANVWSDIQMSNPENQECNSDG